MRLVSRVTAAFIVVQLVSGASLWQTGINVKLGGLATQQLRLPALFPLPADGNEILGSSGFPMPPGAFDFRSLRPLPPPPRPLDPVVGPAQPSAVTSPTPVPLPGAFGLLGAAIVLLIGRGAAPCFRRRLLG